MRALFVIFVSVIGAAVAICLIGCSAPPPAPPPEATTETWYRQGVDQLASIAASAETAFAGGKPDEAAALIEKGVPIESKLLAVPHPSLAAMEAASDLDDLYGRMLLSNRHYEWALSLFQKCSARWKYWQPQTEETARRFQLAQSEMAECNRRMIHDTASAKKRPRKPDSRSR